MLDLIHKLSNTNELKDDAVMYVALQKLNEQHNRKPLYIFWSLVHVVRTYFKLPCFILANAGRIAFNAKAAANAGSFTSLLGETFAAGLVLEIDGYFYSLYKQFGGKIEKEDACVSLGAQTQEVCKGVVESVVRTLGISQLVLVVLMKTAVNKGLKLLWVLPLVAAALIREYRQARPTSSRSNSD